MKKFIQKEKSFAWKWKQIQSNIGKRKNVFIVSFPIRESEFAF